MKERRTLQRRETPASRDAPHSATRPLEVAQRAAIGEFVNRTHAINDENALKMVVLMLPHARRKPVALKLELLAIESHRANPRDARTQDCPANIWQTQTPLVVWNHRANGVQHRIYEHPLRLMLARAGEEDP